MGGGSKIFTRNGGSQESWGWFYNGGWGLFKVSLHTWQRGANPPILWRPTLLPTPLFFKFCPTHSSPPISLSPSNASPTVPSLDLFLWLNGWSCHIWCVILLNDNMDIHMSSLGTLVVVAAPPPNFRGGPKNVRPK